MHLLEADDRYPKYMLVGSGRSAVVVALKRAVVTPVTKMSFVKFAVSVRSRPVGRLRRVASRRSPASLSSWCPKKTKDIVVFFMSNGHFATILTPT